MYSKQITTDGISRTKRDDGAPEIMKLYNWQKEMASLVSREYL